MGIPASRCRYRKRAKFIPVCASDSSGGHHDRMLTLTGKLWALISVEVFSWSFLTLSNLIRVTRASL